MTERRQQLYKGAWCLARRPSAERGQGAAAGRSGPLPCVCRSAELSEAIGGLPQSIKATNNPPLLVDCLLEVFATEDGSPPRW